MPETLDATQKKAIATKLADLKVLQNLMISNEDKLLAATQGNERVTKSITDMLEDDRKSITALEEAITELGMSAESSDTVTSMSSKIEEIMSGNQLALYEKLLQHEGLKHQLVMTGLLIHKSAQATDGVLQKSIDSINKVNFKNRAHQEQLKTIIYYYGVRELVGEEPEANIWGAADDAIAALKGAFGGLTES